MDKYRIIRENGKVMIKDDFTTSLGAHEIVIRHEGISDIRQTINVTPKHSNFKISFIERAIKPY